MKLDWTPVVFSFLRCVWAAGYNIAAVDDGDDGDGFKQEPPAGLVLNARDGSPSGLLQWASDIVCAVDETWLYLRTSQDKRLAVFIVLGNAPAKIVSACAAETQEDLYAFEAVRLPWSDSWEGIECPREREPAKACAVTPARLARFADHLDALKREMDESGFSVGNTLFENVLEVERALRVEVATCRNNARELVGA